MDLLSSAAKWIWLDVCHGINVYIDFYEEIEISKLSGEYKLFISADSQYAVYINGVFVDSGQYPDFPDYKVYDELDITRFMKTGKNTLLFTGYCQGEDSSTYRKETAGII